MQEKLFQNLSEKLFDVAHNQAMELIKIEEDRQFLEDQLKDWKLCLGKVDKELTAVECRKAMRLQQEKMKKVEKKKQQEETNDCSEDSVASYSNFDLTDVDDDTDNDEVNYSDQSNDDNLCDPESQEDRKLLKKARLTVNTQAITPSIAAALDRTNVSSRKAAFIL